MSEVETEGGINADEPNASASARPPSDEAYIQAQIQIGVQRYLAQLTPDKVEETAFASSSTTGFTPLQSLSPVPLPGSGRGPSGPSGPGGASGSNGASAQQLQSDSEKAMAARLKSRRESTAIPYKDLYSSDRRKANKQVPENASFSDARGSLMGSATPATSLAVGLDTRELCMMASLRAPGINGLI